MTVNLMNETQTTLFPLQKNYKNRLNLKQVNTRWIESIKDLKSFSATAT